MFKVIHISSFISLVKLCSDGCTDIIYLKRSHVFKVTHVVLSGNRNQMDDTWDIPLTETVLTPPNIQLFKLGNSIIYKNKPKKELA